MKKLTADVAQRLPLVLILLATVWLMPGCQKLDWLDFLNHPGTHQKTIHVSNIDQLYAAINEAANKGSLIVLAPGVYTLDGTRTNAGRLELLENMGLRGQQGNAGKVVVDASLLPGSSFAPPLNFPAARTGAIRMGKGSNAIEWLTVKGNASAQALSVIETDLIWTGSSQVRVANCVITGGRIGIDIRNVSAASRGRLLEAEVADNEIKDNRVQFGQGIEVQNANGASGAVIHAALHGNYIHGNKIALRAFSNNANGNNTDSASISIASYSDRFDENGLAMELIGGLNQGGAANTATMNLLTFEATGSSFRNNRDSLPPDIADPTPGGIYIAGGLSVLGGQASANTVRVNLSGCPISGNQGPGIKAYGALTSLPSLAGVQNSVQIELTGISRQATLSITPSMPAEAAGTNMVKVLK